MALASIALGGLIVGIDSGYGMLRVASEKVPTAQISNFSLVRAKAETIPFLPGVFEKACLMLSFHHFSDPERAIKEIHQTLRTKGYLVSRNCERYTKGLVSLSRMSAATTPLSANAE